MLDIKLIREATERVSAGLAAKNTNIDLSVIISADAERRQLLGEVERLKAERNRVSGEIARKKKAKEDATADIEAMRAVGERIASLDEQVRSVDTTLHADIARLPNLPHESAPVGADATANVEVRTWGEIPTYDFDVKPHWEIGTELGLLDLEAAARVSGSGFYVLTGDGARLERALVHYMLDMHTADGFTEVKVPYIVTTDTMFGTGQLPKLADDMYHTDADDMWLIPTAEVPVTNLHRDMIIPADQLPIYYVAHTPCFRREAGAAGADTRGMIRVHQFDKVELVKIVSPDTSYDEHESLTAQAEKVLQGLNLPYRVLNLATGDLSFAAAKCYDLELWAPGVGRWLEISSVSNFEDFQARRMKCRTRDTDKRVYHPHTLNGSGLALARLIPAILEVYQNADGTVTIPEVLRPWFGGRTRLGA